MRMPVTKRRVICAGLSLLVALTVGCSKQQGGGGFKMPPTPVETAIVEKGTVSDRFEAVGTIEAAEAITVVSEISAAIVGLPFEEGALVHRGDLIAKLDDSQLRAELERAEAIRDQRGASYERIKSVVEAGAGTPQDLDDAVASLKIAEADLALAEARLAKTVITAPFDGVLGIRRVSRGAFLRAGDAITDLAMIHKIRVLFSSPERYLGKLEKGSKIAVAAPAFPGIELTGTIDVIEPVLDPTTRSATIVARVTNPEGKFRPGMSVNVSAILESRVGALTIPSESIFVEGDQAFVYLVNPDSTVVKTPLTLGARLPAAVEVLQGLAADQRVVRAGHQKLYPGAKVMPIDGQPPAAAQSASETEGSQ